MASSLERSPTFVAAMTLLLAILGSVSFADTLAVLPIICAKEVVVTTVTVALEPLANVPIAQVIVVVPLHVPWLDTGDPNNAVLASSRSVIVTPVAEPGPLLVTTIV